MADQLTTYAMFLRGINVGGHKKVPMADLRALVSQQTGDAHVQSYIASGNVVFRAADRADALTQDLGKAIAEACGFEVPLLLLTADQIADVVTGCPEPGAQGNLLHAYLCYADPALDPDAVAGLRTATEAVTVKDRTVWLSAPDGIGRSKLAAKMETLLGVEVTARNWNTIQKVAAMVRQAG